MANVLHGTQRGLPKVDRGKNPLYESPAIMKPGTMMLPDGTDLRQVTVLSKQDWERIERELNRRQIQNEMARQIQLEREEHKRRSKEIVKNWTNTVAGQRQKRLEARKIREAKEEEERKQIDIEEAKLQALLRKEAIDKAKTQQYYQTDRVKTFHSALILTEVLKEREAQLELKRLKELAMGDHDKEYAKVDKELYEKSIQADLEKAKIRAEAAQNTAEFQKAQILERLEDADKQKQIDIKEGEELKNLAARYRIEKERLDGMRKDETMMVMKENQQQLESVKKLQQLRGQQEEEEDDECRAFASAKRKMMKLRAQKEMEIHNEKQARLDRIRDRLSAQMKRKVDDEEGRLVKAVGEIEVKHLEEERAKEEKLLKEIREQAEHRHAQMKEREEKIRREKQEEKELLEMRHAADKLFQQNEQEKATRRRQEAEQVQNFVVDQYNEFVNKEEDGRKIQLALDKANMELLDKEEAQFQEYAKQVIQHCKEKGRNVYPLERAAYKGVKSGDASTATGRGRVSQNEAQLAGPHMKGQSSSKNRLGFVW